MDIDPALIEPAENYKLLTNLVVPRPIAWVTTVNKTGTVNLAPFSFFNAVGSRPLCVVVSVGPRDDGSPKDTATNIDRTGEFVVNMVTEELVNAMNISAIEFPPDQSELLATGLATASASRIATPRLEASPVSLECRLFQSVPVGANRLFIGEVVMFHVADELMGPRHHVNNFAPIGRLGSPSVYCRTTDRFDLPRISLRQWQARND